MLTIKNYASKLGAVAILLGITFAACKDDDAPTLSLRSKEFKLIKSIADSTQIGTVKLSENADSSINLSLSLTKTVKDTVNKVYLIKGIATAALTDTLYKGELKGTGDATAVEIWKNAKTIKYDSALLITAFAKVRFSATKDSVIAVGNIFKAAK
ncbi:hypothetical protein SAMN05518672_1011576 [Chitinophaga sp. CF118]|uniref:hypothetical protein n=1 Tax=Chitinophaga sp. CF118 TaxID=1884367 RepID=UPI0008F11324|nr:hypothetical protein [Chitinophaga sp. CF118]SFD31306.1 hypothetical protein SAMN05518672_1011576 [Chitinophaga sp. CF118]